MMRLGSLKLKSLEKRGLVERTVRFRIITPVFGGGVGNASKDAKPHIKEPDRITPIRGAAIRGHLRLWWRVLQHETDNERLWEAEKQIWGMASEPGAVSINVRASGSWDEVRVFRCEQKEKGWSQKPEVGMQAIAYGAFPLQAPKEVLDQKDTPKPGVLHRYSAECELELRFPERCQDAVDNAITAWCLLGGIGGRSRRGFGAISGTLPNVVPERWLQEKGFIHKVTTQTWSQPDGAWKFGIEKLQKFRQGLQVGRNVGSDPQRPGSPGRSRWPEPERIRALVPNKANPKYAQRFVKVDKFPRASFGLPINFHFLSDPQMGKFQLKPAGRERLASPLIIRPYLRTDGKYGCLAVLLPYRELDQATLELTGDGGPWPANATLKKEEAHSRNSPLRGNLDPLLSFLDFFELPQDQEKL